MAKRFGSGLKNAILGGGALGLIEKLLNPLKEASEHLDSVFERAKDLTDQAKQFGTSTGTLLKLQTIGKASGISPEEMSGLLVKFQGALVQARANPGEPSAVSQFVNEKDTADAFFKFLQGLKKAGGTNADLATSEVFGERKVLSLSKLLGGDLEGKLAATKGLNTNSATASIANAVSKGDFEAQQKAIIDANGFITQAGNVTQAVSDARVRAEQEKVNRETYQLKHINSLQAIDEKVNQMQDLVTKLLALIGDKVVPLIEKISTYIGAVSRNPLFRGVFKKLGIGQ